MSFTNRAQAGSFGEDPLQYDRSRPSYPDALVDELVALAPSDVVDVGCGTGIVARLLIARGCRVVGVEADPRMAVVARGHAVEVEVAPFEEWVAAGRTFDLLTSGQAWHWVRPDDGVAKAAEVLRAGGRFAVFWNHPNHRPDTMAAFLPIYERHAPKSSRATSPSARSRRAPTTPTRRR